jgi:hypothetical protein
MVAVKAKVMGRVSHPAGYSRIRRPIIQLAAAQHGQSRDLLAVLCI